jgi:hypothetical protein
MAARWLGDLATHPVTAVLSLGVVILGFGGFVFVFHPDVLVIFWAIVIALILLLGKGARLMWRRDRLAGPATAAGQTIQNVETMNVTHNHFYTAPPTPDTPPSDATSEPG